MNRGSVPVRLSIMVREPQPLRKVAYPGASAPIKMFRLGGGKKMA